MKLILSLFFLFSSLSNAQLADPDITQENIKETICNGRWIRNNVEYIKNENRIVLEDCKINEQSINKKCDRLCKRSNKCFTDCYVEEKSRLTINEQQCTKEIIIAHIIPLQLGGYGGAIKNIKSYSLDEFEDRNNLILILHGEVCNDKIKLKDAQNYFE